MTIILPIPRTETLPGAAPEPVLIALLRLRFPAGYEGETSGASGRF